jgi:hypothetical protein
MCNKTLKKTYIKSSPKPSGFIENMGEMVIETAKYEPLNALSQCLTELERLKTQI